MNEENWLTFKNPDAAHRKKVLKAIYENNGYCPSKPNRTPDTKCHCKEYQLHGNCECGLFLKVYCAEIAGDG